MIHLTSKKLITKIIVESASYRQQRCVLAYVTCHSKIEYSFGNVAMPNGEKFISKWHMLIS